MSDRPPKRVLFVDDHADSRELFVLFLETHGFDVVAAENGHEALELLERQSFDSAVVDIGLPGLDGFEVARRIRAARGRAMFLVAMTGYGSDKDKAIAMESGFDAFLVKPVDGSVLAATLSRSG